MGNLLNNYYNKTEVNGSLSLKASSIIVSDLNILVNTKASQLALNDTNTSLNIAYSNISALGDSINNGYTTLSASLTLKASQANLDFPNTTVASKASQSQLDEIVSYNSCY